MRAILVAVGALALVLGLSMILIAPLYMQIGLYKQELSFAQSPGGVSNGTSALQIINDVANQALAVATSGAVIAAAGGALLAYELAIRRAAQASVGTSPGVP